MPNIFDGGGFPFRSMDSSYIKSMEAPMFLGNKETGTSGSSRGTAGSLTVATVIPPGRKYMLRAIDIFCDRSYYIAVAIQNSAVNYQNTRDGATFTMGAGGPQRYTLEFNDIMLYEGAIVRVSGTPIGTEQASLSMRLGGRAMSLFQLDNPDFRIVVLGDSKPLSSIDDGANGERFYVNQLAKQLQLMGKRVSIVDKTTPSASSSDMVKQIKAGALDLPYDLLVVAYGTNNATGSASTANLNALKADLSETIYHRNRTNPNASILFMTPGVTDRTALINNIGGFRTAVAEIANDATIGTTARKVYLCEEHTAFTVSTSAKSNLFKADEVLNDQLHYSMLGHDQVYTNRFLPAVRTTDFYLNVLKLT